MPRKWGFKWVSNELQDQPINSVRCFLLIAIGLYWIEACQAQGYKNLVSTSQAMTCEMKLVFKKEKLLKLAQVPYFNGFPSSSHPHSLCCPPTIPWKLVMTLVFSLPFEVISSALIKNYQFIWGGGDLWIFSIAWQDFLNRQVFLL